MFIPASLIPLQIASIRLGCKRKWSSTKYTAPYPFSCKCLNSSITCGGLRERHLPSLKIGMSQKTQGQGQPREVCIVVKRSIDNTAGTSSGIDSTKSSGKLSRSGYGH